MSQEKHYKPNFDSVYGYIPQDPKCPRACKIGNTDNKVYCSYPQIKKPKFAPDGPPECSKDYCPLLKLQSESIPA